MTSNPGSVPDNQCTTSYEGACLADNAICSLEEDIVTAQSRFWT